MDTAPGLEALASAYHAALPGRLRRYLNGRGITDLLIDYHRLGWDGRRITIPIPDREGRVAFFKLARDPDDSLGPKMLATPGSHAELYGWDAVRHEPARLVLCEGEFDRLVLEAHGFFAATSTGGANVFRRAWAEALAPLPEVCVCFDRDEAGRRGAEKVGRLLPRARIVELPEEVGPSGDVTDFFVRLGKDRADFEALLSRALLLLPEPPAPASDRPARPMPDAALRTRVERIKQTCAIAEVVGRSIALRAAGERFTGLCPFHPDHTPSLVVFPETGTFHCFGCGAHGDAIAFLQKLEGVGFREALERLDPPAESTSAASTSEKD